MEPLIEGSDKGIAVTAGQPGTWLWCCSHLPLRLQLPTGDAVSLAERLPLLLQDTRQRQHVSTPSLIAGLMLSSLTQGCHRLPILSVFTMTSRNAIEQWLT